MMMMMMMVVVVVVVVKCGGQVKLRLIPPKDSHIHRTERQC